MELFAAVVTFLVSVDASRHLYGYTDVSLGHNYRTGGVFYNGGGGSSSGGWANISSIDFNNALVTPVASENRPANKAVRYLIKALP